MNNKALYWIFGILLVFGLAFLVFRGFYGNEDTWICDDNQWVKHGNPSSPMPTSGCGTPSNQNSSTNQGAPSLPREQVNNVMERYGKSQIHQVKLSRPAAGQVMTSPFTVVGNMPSNWFFEAVAGIKLYDGNGNLIAQTQAQATGDWMQAGVNVPFKGTLRYTTPSTPTGYLVLLNDNPSGLQQNEKSEVFNIRLWPTVKVYFNKNDIVCELVTSTDRFIKPTVAVARAALEQLLAGPTETEKNQGFGTAIPTGVKIQSLTIENGVAKVDFNEALEAGVGGSCRTIGIRTQITETLKQFSTVKSAVISIDGRTEDILQP